MRTTAAQPLLLLLLAAVAASSDLRPLPTHKCWCNFGELDAELKQLYRTDQNHAEMVFSFVNTLISLNFKLTNYLTEFRQCTRFWLDSVGNCDAACSCQPGRVCCRDTSLTSLHSSVATLKRHVKLSFTMYSNIRFINDYQDATFNILNVFSSSFLEFMDALTVGRVKATRERSHFVAFFHRMRKDRPLHEVFAQTMGPTNASRSIISRMAGHFGCDTTKVLPFYLNVYGVVLQYMFMKELNDELQLTAGQMSKSKFSDEAEWQQYLQLTDNMTKNIIACSTQKIFAIRSQEIKEKDLAMRNAAIVFSSFLLILVIIIALIAVFACRAGSRSRENVVIRDEPIMQSEESENRDLLYKRYYEADETV